MSITIHPIGTIHSLFDHAETGGRQPTIDGQQGHIMLNDEFSAGLTGLDEFSHIIALYYFHRQPEVRLKARPCFDPTCEHGIFASRYPTRPNHIGISVWSITKIIQNTIYCADIDVLDGTPLLDIKPYVKHFDHPAEPRCGWYDNIDWDVIWSEINQRHAEDVV